MGRACETGLTIDDHSRRELCVNPQVPDLLTSRNTDSGGTNTAWTVMSSLTSSPLTRPRDKAGSSGARGHSTKLGARAAGIHPLRQWPSAAGAQQHHWYRCAQAAML